MPYKDVSPPGSQRILRCGWRLFSSVGYTRHMDMPTCSRVISASHYRRERWRNDLGWTNEIHAGAMHAGAARVGAVEADKTTADMPQADTPQANTSRIDTSRIDTSRTDSSDAPPAAVASDWDWRLSIAEIEQDARFSMFPGVERELVLLGGAGLRLRFDDGQSCLLEPPHGRLRFAGERAVTGELIDGHTRDFNLMWRREAVDAELLHRPLIGPMVFFADATTTWALHLLAGQAHFDAGSRLPPMHAGDTALLSETQRTRFLLDGGGELLAIRLSATQVEAASPTPGFRDIPMPGI